MRKLPADQQVEFLRGLVEINVQAIAEYAAEVQVMVGQPNHDRLVLSVYVDPRDFGLVLGNEGATLDAVRRIAWTACKKTHLRCDIDLLQSRPPVARTC